MRKGGGKQKGRAFEIKMCRTFGQWLGDQNCLWHTAISGGRGRFDPEQAGDIAPSQGYHIQNWNFGIELKKQQCWTLEGLIKNPLTTPIALYWKQCTRDAKRGNKVPILIISKNCFEPVLVFSKQLSNAYPHLTLRLLEKRVMMFKMGRKVLNGMLLSTFLEEFSPDDFNMRIN